MPNINDLVRVNDVVWELPAGYRPGMQVPARIFASEKQVQDMLRDRSLDQLVNVASLPGVVAPVLVMPDAHEGYGFPIGGVAATPDPDGIISPGGIGYDINCGVRLLLTRLTVADITPYADSLADGLFHAVPSGVGRGGSIRLSDSQFDAVLSHGVSWAVKSGYAEPNDPDHIESRGSLYTADPDTVSHIAKKRGRDQLGTIGAGNHFVEVDRVAEIMQPDIADAYGLAPDMAVVLIHTGSRGLGHQVATEYIRQMLGDSGRFGYTLPDRELACAPLSSDIGARYFHAMCAAANFAWTNRQIITWEVRSVFRHLFGEAQGALSLLYDVAHNIAKTEEHHIGGKRMGLIVHRKGATRAFGPNHPEIPSDYRAVGQPVLIPGSMGTASYVLAGAEGAMEQSFGSCCHGAGRTLSRHAAKKTISGNALVSELESRGIRIRTGSVRDLPEEGPLAYKDVDDVVRVVETAGIARIVAKLTPMIVIKG